MELSVAFCFSEVRGEDGLGGSGVENSQRCN